MMRRQNRSAFTLMELIVSLAITAVIALFVFSFATSLAQVWRSSESGVSTELDAQITLDTIAKDLESALFLEKGTPMFAVSVLAYEAALAGEFDRTLSGSWEAGSARPVEVDFEPEVHRYGWAGSWLRFFAAQPIANAVGYQLIRRPPLSASDLPLYLLHRTVVRQDYTLGAGFDITAPAYTSEDTTTSCLNAPRIYRPCLDDVILEDVIDFGVRLYIFDEQANVTDHSPKGLRLIFPFVTGAGALDDGRRNHYGESNIEGGFDVRYPDVVEVFLRVLDNVGSQRLQEIEQGASEESYEAVLDRHSRLYRRMVRLPGKEPVAYVGP